MQYIEEGNRMEVLIEKLPYEKKLVLNHLMELYNYDFSEFEDTDVNDFGLYGYEYIDHYWTDEGRYPYIIKVDGKIAGFVLVRNIGINSHGEKQYSIAEFFVLKKYRRKSVGKRVAFEIFNTFHGEWKIGQIENNIPANRFWINVISEYTGGNFEEIREEEWEGPIQIFESKK